ncbi:MAG: adenosine kinase [Victivallaceae bacterium]|nr:adenosine kinase [Victivallaceae bacterium]
MKTPRIAGIGAPIVDLVLRVSSEELTRFDCIRGSRHLVAASRIDEMLAEFGRAPELMPGGSVGNTMTALARLGVESFIHGTAGRDMYGQFYCEEFSKAGGRLELMAFSNSPTGRCLSLVTPDAERTMFTALGAAGEPTAPPDFSGFDRVYFEGYILDPPGAEALFEAAVASGARIALDLSDFRLVETRREAIADLLTSAVDEVFANRVEAAALLGADAAPERLAARLGEYCETAVVTLGAEGCAVKTPDGRVSVYGALAADAVDTTGAGDLFHAGFMYGLAYGCPVERCAFFGAVLGAEVVKTVGAVIPPGRWGAAALKLQITNEDGNGI